MLERQELYCHECGHYVQFNMDMALNGNHVLECPNCGHEHCRVVNNGKITDIRWDQRNKIQTQAVYTVSQNTMTHTFKSTFDTSSGSYRLYSLWMNTAISGSSDLGSASTTISA